MRAIQITSYEGPKAIETVELERPVPGSGEVLIEVHAAGVAFPELLQNPRSLSEETAAPLHTGSRGFGRRRRGSR